MVAFEEKLCAYMDKENINAELLRFEHSCHSVAEAAQTANVEVGEIIKNVCLVNPGLSDSRDRLIVAIVKGEDRVSTKRVAKALSIERPRTASPDEILAKTGYPCGGTPSFGFQATFLIDSRVSAMDQVYTGGGSPNALIRIRVDALLRANGGRVVRVRK